ncbi:type I polyketide synthase [Nocardia sienata]|uniref:type I polyketide synthase n=1 Tax=Nocardia sienata TaxID=248552 RepID=UPI0007A4E1B5|nr:type I polyketide synthase [Nocardia sienata]
MSESAARTVPPVAIVGVSAVLPGEPGADGFWRTVVSGADRVSDIPATHWLVDDYFHPDPAATDKTYARRGAFLSPVPFDPLAFGIPPKAIEATDTSQLLALVVAERLLSSLEPHRMSGVDRERVSVVLGTSALELLTTMAARMERPVWLAALRESGIPEDRALQICDRIAEHYVPWQEGSLPGMLSNVVAGRIANRFDLHGSNYTTDAACASSLAALSSGINELALGQADLVVAGGVDTLNDPVTYTSFSKTPALSPTGDCRPFSADADGMILGEGVVMFALRRLAEAERDGDPVYAVIRGIGTASDGRGGAIYAPRSTGQARALRRAYAMAGYGPDTVELVEAHGTGTAAGDAAEVAALRTVFGETGRADTGWCALGSVKSQVGHTKNAAGAAGLLKATLALHHRVLPPTIKVDRPNPALELHDSPFYLNTAARPWISDGSHPRRAGVSSFGFGGTNFHVTLEEYTPTQQSTRPAPLLRAAGSELVLLSADSPAALVAAARSLAETTDGVVAVARRTQESFDPAAAVRLGVVVTADDLAATLGAAADRIAAQPTESFTGPGGMYYGAYVAEPGPVGFLFSGQGSQYIGMGAELAMVLPAARESWDAVAALDRSGEEQLHRVVFPPPAFTEEERAAQRARLTQTEWAQPALAAQSLAALALLDTLGVRPDALGGHSFGELVALHAAGCFDNATLLKLARRRGELMRDAATEPGAMVAVVGTLAEVRALVESAADSRLWVANHNAPRQVVVSGALSAVAAFERQAAAAGHTVRRVAAAGAFHTPLVAAAAAPLRETLDSLAVRAPRIPVYGNARGEPYPADPDAVRAGLAEQLAVPVRFVDQIEAMYTAGIRTFIEVGAGATLTRLAGEVLAGREHLAVSLDRAARGADNLPDALARLAVGGLRMEFTALWSAYDLQPEEDKVSSKPSPAAVNLLGANYGKPYPPAGGSAALPPPNPPTSAPPAGNEHAVPADAAVTGAAGGWTAPPATQDESVSPAYRDGFVSPPAGHGPVPAPAPSRPAASGSEWLDALRETQRLAGEAHSAYQRTMTESHLAFLRMSEAALVQLAGGTAASAFPPPAAAPTHQHLTSGTTTPAPLPSVMYGTAAPAHRPPTANGTPGPAAIARELPRAEPMPAAPDIPPAAPEIRSPQPSPADVPAPSPDSPTSVDVAGLLAVVAEKTGYPADVLDVDMELESDLGIDSIKRVEILSAVRERFPGIREVDAVTLGSARTLAQVAGLLGAEDSAEATLPAGEPPPDDLPAPLVPMAGALPAETFLDDAGMPPLRLTIRPTPRVAPGLALPGLLGSRVAITGGTPGIADLLAKELVESGVDARVAPGPSADIHGLIHLGMLGTAPTVDAALTADRDAFRLARSFATERSAGPAFFVTVQDTGGDFGLSGIAPAPTGLAALARTAGREWPDVTVKAIDCDARGGTDADIARAIAGELLGGGTATDVGLAVDGTRTVLETVQVAPNRATGPAVGPDSVIVVSGGARGVTAAAVRALARAAAPKLVLLGRTPLTDEPAWLSAAYDETAVREAVIAHLRAEGTTPDPRRIRAEVGAAMAAREIRETLRAVETAGSPVRYVTVDVTDTEAVRIALAGIRAEWGPVTGLVHGAGVLADKTIGDKSDEQFDRVFETKVGGLRSLLTAVDDDPLELLCVFSSVSACYGNAGQSDYAMANEVITQLAAIQQRRRPGCSVRAIAWGPWDGGMVDETLAAHFGAAGIPLISPADGAAAFVEELSEEGGPVCVVRAAGHPDAADARGAGGDLALTARDHEYLFDHRIGEVPVVPVALVLEWFTGAARAALPDGTLTLSGLEVLSKIALDDFAARTTLLRLVADRPDPVGTLLLTVSGRAGRPHFRARATVSDTAPHRWTEPTGLRPLGRDTYDGKVLFHGPAFQVLTGIDGVAPAGAAGVVTGTRERNWPQAHRYTDPAAVDGALQLATLWAEHVLGTAVLPMGVAEFRLFVPGPLDGAARVIVRAGRTAGRSEAHCDVQVCATDGHPLFELGGVRLIARPDIAG